MLFRSGMKRLLLLRHADAARDDALDDADRPLTPRGRRDAKAVGRRLRRKKTRIDRVLCSPARRTRETLELLGALPGAPAVDFVEGLYMASADEHLRMVRAASGDAERVLVIGHNPGLALFARSLADRKRSRRRAVERLAEGLPKSALLRFKASIDRWRALSPAGARLTRFVPRPS